jgi:hypothetical protein
MLEEVVPGWLASSHWPHRAGRVWNVAGPHWGVLCMIKFPDLVWNKDWNLFILQLSQRVAPRLESGGGSCRVGYQRVFQASGRTSSGWQLLMETEWDQLAECWVEEFGGRCAQSSQDRILGLDEQFDGANYLRRKDRLHLGLWGTLKGWWAGNGCKSGGRSSLSHCPHASWAVKLPLVPPMNRPGSCLVSNPKRMTTLCLPLEGSVNSVLNTEVL